MIRECLLKNLQLVWVFGLLGTVAAASAMAQNPAQSGGEPQSEQALPNGGLGGLFAESIQEWLQAGNIFLPNGQSAQPVNPDASDEPEKFTLNFNNAQIDQALKFVSDLTKKVVLKSDQVQGQITVMSPNEVTKEEALSIIDEAFMLKGLTFIETDKTIICLPISEAKQKGVDVKIGTGLDASSRIETRVLELNYAMPSDIKEAFGELMSENANIVADDRTKTLIVTDSGSNIQRLATLINQLDKPGTAEGAEIRVFRLKYLDANQLARDIDDVLENIVNAKRGTDELDENVEVLSDRTSNSLIISAPKDALDAVGDFIESLDVGSAGELVEETFTLKSGDAQEVAETLGRLAESRRSNVYRPSIVADTRSNTVIVSAYPEDIEMFGNLINQLDQKTSYDQVTQIFPLENADAVIVSDLVEQLLGSGSDDQNRGYYYYYFRSQNETENHVKIVTDQRLNALVISARPADMPKVERLIEQLDQPIPMSKEEPRIYPVKYVRASDLAAIVNELFAQQQQIGFFGGSQQQPLTGLTGKVKVLADPATNSLIVIAATPRAFQVVENLIDKLDRLSPEFSSTRVINLKNADADYLQSKLTAMFEQQQQQGGQQGGGFFWFLNQSLGNQPQQISNLIGNVRIESETRTNSLLVTTNSQYFPAIENLVEELDRAIEQVEIEILIVEVQDIDDRELGIDWDGQIPIHTEGEFNAPLSDISSANFTVLSQANFDLVLNYLAETSNTNVVARPNILTGDNQTAFVEAINRIPRPDEFAIGTSTTNQSIVFEEVGLKLTVRPHINDATTVTIDVDLENGQILEGQGLVSDLGTIPAFTRRTIQTLLTVNDSETAVLSGVIDNTYVDSEKGIPGLMHIPLLGNLFKTRGRSRNKTELMAFITPHILSNQQDRLRVLEKQRERLDIYQNLGQQMENMNVKFGVTDSVQ